MMHRPEKAMMQAAHVRAGTSNKLPANMPSQTGTITVVNWTRNPALSDSTVCNPITCRQFATNRYRPSSIPPLNGITDSTEKSSFLFSRSPMESGCDLDAKNNVVAAANE
mmetsp:Transcript_11626/g.29416  ORF Transcript_11626/g.29416 Transcript_11626/m.29416 type:complete len:110 (+) Transcript_11626:209-538(+)